MSAPSRWRLLRSAYTDSDGSLVPKRLLKELAYPRRQFRVRRPHGRELGR